MLKLLVPVDGSKDSDRAVAHAIGFVANSKAPVELHVLNVQLPIASGGVRMFFKREDIEAYYQDSGQVIAVCPRATRPGRANMCNTSAPARSARPSPPMRRNNAAIIVMGSRGLNAVSGMVLGSVATR